MTSIHHRVIRYLSSQVQHYNIDCTQHVGSNLLDRFKHIYDCWFAHCIIYPSTKVIISTTLRCVVTLLLAESGVWKDSLGSQKMATNLEDKGEKDM